METLEQYLPPSASAEMIHTLMSLQTWLGSYLALTGSKLIRLDGNNLSISGLVAVARGAQVEISHDPVVATKMKTSIDLLAQRLREGWTIYGVNTGFGGSADARTDEYNGLQFSALQHTQCGIISKADHSRVIGYRGLPTVLSEEWTRAAMATRANQLLRGHSAIRMEVIDTIAELLNNGITPLVPKRGSVSASGDLMPLSFIAGAIAGNPAIACRSNTDTETTWFADKALAEKNIKPIMLKGKEGLALINGTAPSAGAAAITVDRANLLAVLAQLLTAMTAECLAGNVEWAASFIHAAHPQQGQMECASNIREFLQGSKLVQGLNLSDRTRTRAGVCQDRYSTRTSPQWLGPYMDDLSAASKQIQTELNSTSDNPLIDVESGDIFHGGNFQATAITSAMDKARQAVVAIGRLIYSQCQELVDPTKNNGLSANLVADSPSNSFTMKGIDTVIAGYMSELSSLAGPVVSHIYPAEMGNQGVNSMALLSCRKTDEALDILTHMMASHIYVLCQAADLRCLQESFINKTRVEANIIADKLNIESNGKKKLGEAINLAFSTAWKNANTVPTENRIDLVRDAVGSCILRFLNSSDSPGIDAQKVFAVSSKVAMEYGTIWAMCQQSWADVENQLGRLPTTIYLSPSTGHLYRFIREALKIPLNHGTVDDPMFSARNKTSKKTIGGYVSDIYDSIMDNRLLDHIMLHVVLPLIPENKIPVTFSYPAVKTPLVKLTEVKRKQLDDEVENNIAEAFDKYAHRHREN